MREKNKGSQVREKQGIPSERKNKGYQVGHHINKEVVVVKEKEVMIGTIS